MICKIYLFLLLILTLPINLISWNVVPMKADIINPKKPYTFITADGLSDQSPCAIEVSIKKRNIYGIDNDLDTPNLFFSYPKTFVLKPQQQKKIRIMYKGDLNDLQSEDYYYIDVKEIPVDLQSKKKKCDVVGSETSFELNLSLLYKAVLYITPVGALPNIIISNCSIVEAKDANSPHLYDVVLDIENKGNKRGKLRKPKITLKSLDETFSAHFSPLYHELPVILAKQQRSIKITVPENILPENTDISKISVSID